MKIRFLKAVCILTGIISVTTLLLLAANTLGMIAFSHRSKIIAGFSAVINAYISVFLTALNEQDSEKRKQLIHTALICIFVFYIIILIDFTLIDDGMGRNIFKIYSWSKKSFEEYLKNSTNFIPFATVWLFVNAYEAGTLPISAIAENIAGNFIAFMPLPLFLSLLCPFFNKPRRILTVAILSSMTIEFLQLVFLTGACDIDDVILNVAGAATAYLILKTKWVKHSISRLTFDLTQ